MQITIFSTSSNSCVDYFAVAVGVKELYTTNKKLLQEGIRYAVWRTTIRGVFNRL